MEVVASKQDFPIYRRSRSNLCESPRLSRGFTYGNYSSTGLPTGNYFVRTNNNQGFINELFDDIPCLGCDVATGTKVNVFLGVATVVDFELDTGGQITGTITASAGGGISTAGVSIFDLTGEHVSDVGVDPKGNYSSTGLLPGDDFVRTWNDQGFIDTLWDNIVCLGCNPTSGNPVSVVIGTDSLVNFSLDAGARITGTVTSGGNPLPNINVQIYFPNGQWANGVNTNADGTYSSTGLPDGDYVVRTWNDQGFIDELYDGIPCLGCNVTTGQEVSVSLGNDQVVNFALDLGGQITGTIADAAGTPLSGPSVDIFDATGEFVGGVGTDSNGNYVSSGLPPGDYFVRTNNNQGFINKLFDDIPCVQCDVTTGTPVNVAPGVARVADFLLDAGGGITGTVTDTGGAPIEGISVRLFDATGTSIGSTRTSIDGTYSTTGLPTGSYFARTRNSLGFIDEIFDGFPCLSGCNNNTTSSTPIAVVEGQATVADFELQIGGTISGTVSDFLTEDPIQHIRVRIFDVNGIQLANSTTRAGGTYTSTGLPEGTYFVRTEGLTNFQLGYIRELYDDIICQFCVPTTGSPVVVTENSTTTVNFALAKGAQIRGQILDEGAQPLANISVFVYDANGRLVSIGRSVANGDYISRDGLLPGVYYARTFNSRGYINERYLDVECLGRCQVTGGTPIEIPDGAAFVDNIDFSLVVGGRISGLVTNTSGAPLRRIRISVRDDDGFEVTARNTANDGTYTTGAGIPDGTYFVVTTNTLGYVNEVHPNTVCLNCDPATAGLGIDVTADNTVPGIDFDLALGGNISGIVTASDGTPLEGVVVEVLTDPADPVATSGTTNAAGFYTTTESLPTGNYEVRTSNGLGFVNEVFDDLSCEFGCPIGLPVVVTPPPRHNDRD